jgi:hypothetical protein
MAGIGHGLTPDKIHLEARKAMRLRVDRCGPSKGAMVMEADKGAPSVLDCLHKRMKKGVMFRKPAVSAATRWGTRIEGQSQLGVDGRVFAAGLVPVAGDGTLPALIKGAAAPFQMNGLQVDGTLRMSAKLGNAVRCLTSQMFIFYHALARFKCTYGVRPMLLAFSKDLECPASSVCGVGSYFRRLLILVTDQMWVGKFNSADGHPKAPYLNKQAPGRIKPFEGTSHRFDDQIRKKSSGQMPHGIVKLAHRAWQGLGGSHKPMFLLNPNTNVKSVLGEFCNPEMEEGVRDLLRDFRRISEMSGELEFLPTLEIKWKERERVRAATVPASHWSAVIAAGKDKPGGKPGLTAAEKSKKAVAIAGAQYSRNMHKAQWAFREIMNDVVKATEAWFDHELYSLIGFLACMIQTRWVSVLELATGKKMKILIAHENAIPNGQVGSRILDELAAQFVGQGEAAFLDYYPPQLSDMLKDDDAMQQLPNFLGGGAMEGFHLLDPDGNVILAKTGRIDNEGIDVTEPVVAGPAPLWRFPSLARRVLKLYFRQLSSNDVERVFSLVARGFRGGGKNVGFRTISVWCRRKDWVSGRFFGKEVDPEFLQVFGAARRLMRENIEGFQKVFDPDADSSEQRKRFRQQNALPAYITQGTRKFDATNMEPCIKERWVGPKKESSKDPTLLAAKPVTPAIRKGLKNIVARRNAMNTRQRNCTRGRVSATLPQNRKRKAPAVDPRSGRRKLGRPAHLDAGAFMDVEGHQDNENVQGGGGDGAGDGVNVLASRRDH